MNKLFRWLLLGLAFGTAAFAVDTIPAGTDRSYTTVYTYDWTSDGSGNATGRVAVEVPGIIQSIFTAPGSATPSDNYDVAIEQAFTNTAGTTASQNVDLLGGVGANRDNATNELTDIWPGTLTNIRGKLQIEITNAGSAKTGRVQVFVYRTLAISLNGLNTFIPTSGSAAQILQYNSPALAKYVTVSGDGTIADGGALSIAPGDGNAINFGDSADYGIDYNAADDSLRILRAGTTFAKFLPSWNAGTTGNTLQINDRTGDTQGPALLLTSETQNLGAKIILDIDDDGNNIGHIQWRGDATKTWDMSVIGNDPTHMDFNYSDTDQRVFRLESTGNAIATAVANSGTASFVADSNTFTNTTAKFAARVTADGSQAQHTWELPGGTYWNAYMVGSSPNVWHLFRSSEGSGANADQLTITGGTSAVFSIPVGVNHASGLTTDQSTVAVFNVTPTTVNAFGAATAMTLGATTGTGTFRNATAAFSGTTAFTVAAPATFNGTSVAINPASGPALLTGKNPATTVSGNAFLRLTGISSDSDNSSGTNAARIDLGANGAQTGVYPNGQIDFLVASGTGDLASVMTIKTGGITIADGKQYAYGTGTGVYLGTATSQKIGLWGVTPVVQPSSTGEATGYTGAGGTALTHTDTFTGNSGTKAYTINDIVKHLKAVGILAGS